MSATPNEDVDITDIMSALSAARDQSIFQVLEDMKRFDPTDAMEQFRQAALPRMPFDAVLSALKRLPELDSVTDRVFRKRARILTELGMLLYAVTCDPLHDNYWVLAGVHCFANEDCDLERRNSFVLLDFEGHAAILQSDLFEKAMDPSSHGTVYLLHVYDVLIEGQNAPTTA